MPIQSSPRVVLSFSPSDPTAGSGLQADVLIAAALGVYPLSVLTGYAVQDSSRVEASQSVDGDWVADQARALLEDIPVHAFKLGGVVSPENAAEVADVLTDYPDVPVVFCPSLPVFTEQIVEEEMIGALCELLVPLSTVLVIDGELALRFASDEDELQESELTGAECARRLIEFGASHVLLTGASQPGPQIVNTLYGEGGVLRTDAWERLPGGVRGSGDTLSAALAAFLAQGMELSVAVHAAQAYTWQTLAQGWRLGMGHVLPNRWCDWVRP